MPLVIATKNPGKVEELALLLPPEIRLLTAGDLGIALPEETGATYLENARLKAHAVAQAGYPALADDSGLEVDALQRQPGVRSARYAGEAASDDENNALLLRNIHNVPDTARRARFVSVVCLVLPNGDEYCGVGTVEGTITHAPRGSLGFGYDPLFEIDDPQLPALTGHTFAEIPTHEKNRVSHRARAVHDVLRQLDARSLRLASLTGD